MCQPISAILTKEGVYFGDTDSHECILEQHGLHEGIGMAPNILRVEISPPGKDLAAPAEQWVYRVDQDKLPVWADAEEDERRARGALGRSGIWGLYADYEAKLAPLYADYKAKLAPLYADYEAKRASLDADYEAKLAPLYADYKAKLASLYADYEAKRAPLYPDYEA